jgi:hypothetical protein
MVHISMSAGTARSTAKAPTARIAAAAAPDVAPNAQRPPTRRAATVTRPICQIAKTDATAHSTAGTTMCDSSTSAPMNTAIEMLPKPMSSATAAQVPRK